MTNKDIQEQGWEKEFDDRFMPMSKEDFEQNNLIKSFIAQALLTAEQRGAERERDRYQETIKELLEWLPDSNNYEYCWEDCTSKEQDKVKEIRQKYQSLQREGGDKE